MTLFVEFIGFVLLLSAAYVSGFIHGYIRGIKRKESFIRSLFNNQKD